MKNLTTQLLGLAIMGAITFSCTSGTNNGHNTEKEGHMRDDKQSMSDSTDNRMQQNDFQENEFQETDTVHNYREGTPISDRIGSMDTIMLPQPIMEAIEMDSVLKKAMIVEKVKHVENGETLYHISFYPVNGKEEDIVFDSKGKRKQN